MLAMWIVEGEKSEREEERFTICSHYVAYLTDLIG